MFVRVILMHENKWNKILKRKKKSWVKQVGGDAMVGNKKKKCLEREETWGQPWRIPPSL